MADVKSKRQEAGGGSAAASRGKEMKKARISTENADRAVEEYLQSYCDQLVQDVHEHAEKLIANLQDEVERGKAEILALARGDAQDQLCTITLVGKEGPYSECRFSLEQTDTKREFMIGRSTGKRFKEGGVSLPQDCEISTVHAKLTCRGGQIFLEDLGSTNGTSLNGTPLESKVPVRVNNADEIRVGSSVFDVQIQFRGEGLEVGEDEAATEQ